MHTRAEFIMNNFEKIFLYKQIFQNLNAFQNGLKILYLIYYIFLIFMISEYIGIRFCLGIILVKIYTYMKKKNGFEDFKL